MATQTPVQEALGGWLADAAVKAHVDWGAELQRMRDLLPLPFPALQPPPFDLHPAGWEPIWWPINSAQQMAINCRAELLLFGGQSGGGKTSFLAADAMQEYRNPYLRSLILRTTKTEMGELSDQMRRMYEPLGAKWKRPNKFEDYAWCFPNGGTVTPGYIRNEKDLNRYQGNPESHIGLDESGQHAEKLIRRLLGWLAAPRHSMLFVRARFGSNPGGPGHGWQSSVFLRGRCPVHYPADAADSCPSETSVFPGRVYKGARWPSDGSPVYKTTAFIPARLIDNPLYDRVKLESLLTQTADIREQLLYGCWCNAEGLYFPFLRPEFLVPFQTIGREWWWGHFISIDYGYGNSAAAAGLYCISPAGVVFKVGERIEKKMNSKEFARRIVKDGFKESANPRQGPMEAWTRKLRPRDPEGPHILWAMFDPANDQHTGTGQSNYEQMSEVFNAAGIPTMLGAHDPMGNAQNLYNGLVNREFQLTSLCPYTYNTLISRVVDERKAVKKEKGNPQDDCYDECLIEGTRVRTPEGEVPIESLKAGQLVMTRKGPRSVQWAAMTRPDADLYHLELSNGESLIGTANHPVFIEGRGFIRMDETKYGDKLLAWENVSSMWSSIEGSRSADIPNQSRRTTAAISARVARIASVALRICTGKSTSRRSGRFRPASTSTIGMKTPSTTTPPTSNLSKAGNTAHTTSGSGWGPRRVWRALGSIWNHFAAKPPAGTDRRLERSGTANRLRSTGISRSSEASIAPTAAGSSSPIRPGGTGSALLPVPLPRDESPASTTSLAAANSAAPGSRSTATPTSATAPPHVVSGTTGGRGRVFNISVAGEPEYFANGVLVHNCAYAWNTWKEESVKPERVSLEQEIDQMRRDGIDETSIARYSWRRLMEIRAAEQKAEHGIPLTGRRIGRRITRR